MVEKSLRTSDRRQAEILALPMIAEHKAALLAARPRLEPAWVPRYPPGLHVGPDGGRIFATERELHHLDTQGAVALREPNGGDGHRFVNLPLGAYLQHANVTGYYEREARTAWALFKSRCDKPLKDATRNDGRKVVQHFEAQRLKAPVFAKRSVGRNRCG